MSHDRTLDHFGTEDTTTSVLSAAIGQYPAGTDLQTVLEGMIGRLVRLETMNIEGSTFTANAYIARYLTADAVLKKNMTSVATFYFVASAQISNTTFSFTANAVKAAVAHPSTSFTADAFFIDMIDC
jgi:hypothetical protein